MKRLKQSYDRKYPKSLINFLEVLGKIKVKHAFLRVPLLKRLFRKIKDLDRFKKASIQKLPLS